MIDQTAGVSPAYIKELLRKAALLAVVEGGGPVVTDRQLQAAMAELNEGGRLAQRLLGFRPETAPGGRPGWPVPPTGFPPVGPMGDVDG